MPCRRFIAVIIASAAGQCKLTNPLNSVMLMGLREGGVPVHFLLVNDDGFQSPELQMLCRAAAGRGHRVTVVAPSTQQSGKSHCFTITNPLTVYRGEMPGADAAWQVEGTPVDCTRLGLYALAEGPVDLVISGINQGYNIGLATYVSGTVGAAREAAFDRGRALAVSTETSAPPEMRAFTAEYAIRTAEKLVTADVPPQSVCNLNTPACRVEDIRGARVCSICHLMYRDGYERYDGPRGQTTYWLKPMETQWDREKEPESDLALLLENWITLTFLTPEPCDQTPWRDFPVAP